jgi:signal transduction histidine kinase
MAGKYNVKVQYAAWIAVATLGTVVIMTGLHLLRDMDARESAARLRAELTAKALASAAAPGMAATNLAVLAKAVVTTVQDDEVLHVRILNAQGEELYRPQRAQPTQNLLLVSVPIGPETDRLGAVEVGLGRASAMAGVMKTALLDLGLGLVLVAVFVGGSVIVSRPVRESLKELNSFVKRVAAGEAKAEQLDSDLAEVDEVGQTLHTVMARVEEAQTKLTRAQQELKSAQKEMDEYTYVISHDLKEPLRGIEAFSKFLADGYRDKLDENGRHHIDVIRQSVLRMQRLIGDLLKFSRMASQKNPMTPVGLNSMLMHVRLNLQYALDQKKVELLVDKLPTVVCDATAMTEVFHNLISNAIKYNENPQPVVEVGCVEKPNERTGVVEYQFHVRDNGVGIKKEYFDKIFQLFQRLHRDDQGTGIGLTIVKRVIEWHGGRIWLESEEGKGTTFYFTLPKRETTKSGTIIEMKSAPQGGGSVAQTV